MNAHSTGFQSHSLNETDDSFVLTTSGSKLRVSQPHEDQIKIQDILASLPKLCRFTGHCAEFYSVAQHSVLAYRMAGALGCSLEHQQRALLHDFSEAYVNDLNSPVKNAIHRSYRDFEAGLENIISVRLLGKPVAHPPVVKTIDKALYHAEASRLMPEGGEDHHEAISALGMGVAVLSVVWEGFSCWDIERSQRELTDACRSAGVL